MTVILHALSYLAVIAGFVFGLLSLANGLLYIAEVIEEHAQLAKSVGQRLVYVEIVLLALLYAVDGLPLHLVGVGILAHVVYLQNFSRHWPVISIKSLTFVASCALVLLTHFLSFRHFSDRSASSHSYHGRSAYGAGYDSRRGRYAVGSSHEDSFLDVATYFAVCVWLVPFYLFLSLSANDNVLPSAGETPSPSQPSSPSIAPKAAFLSPPSRAPDSPSLGRHQRQRSSMMKSALSSAFSIMPASLRPAHLSSHLPLPQGKSGPSTSPRQDLPRSPSPTYHFHSLPGSAASTPLPTPGLSADENNNHTSGATSAFSAAVAANGSAAGSTFVRAKRPVPLRSVTASPTITTENLSHYPPAPHSATILVSSPLNSTFAPRSAPPNRPTNGNSNSNSNGSGGGPLPSPSGMSALARSQPASPAQSRFPVNALSSSVGASSSGIYAQTPPRPNGITGPQAPGLSTSLSNQGSSHYTGLGVSLARRNTVDAGVSAGAGSGASGSIGLGMGAPTVRRPSAMADGIQQRRPPPPPPPPPGATAAQDPPKR
ncbi:hypothetical protein JCM10908_002831 [Rhodotorula pacifica]|uniref:Svp26p n=1 Tax=Rhodotorula pacifica TaxID=1495444 RepID=UPI003173CA92